MLRAHIITTVTVQNQIEIKSLCVNLSIKMGTLEIFQVEELIYEETKRSKKTT